MARHPNIRFGKPEALSSSSAVVNSTNLDFWFSHVKQYYDEHEIFEFMEAHPENIINLDETGIDLNVMPKKTLSTKNVKHNYKKESAKHRERVTVTLAVGADGKVYTPQVIFKGTFGRGGDALKAAFGNA